MRYFVICFLLWFTATLSSSAGSAEKNEHRIITIDASLKAAMEKNPGWKICGNYFAEAETAKNKIVHFTFEKGPPKKPATIFTFVMLDRVTVSINEKATTPLVMVLGEGLSTEFLIVMNMKDYKTALPCISKGMKV